MRTTQSAQTHTNHKSTTPKCSLSDEFITLVLGFYSNPNRFSNHNELEPSSEKMDLARSILENINFYRSRNQPEEALQLLIYDLNGFIDKYPQVDTFFFCAKCFVVLSARTHAKALLEKILNSTSQQSENWEVIRILAASKELMDKC